MSVGDLQTSRIEGLKKQYDLLTEKITRLRLSLAIETETTVKFKIENQIRESEEERAEVERLIHEVMGRPSDRHEYIFLLNRILLSLLVAILFFSILFLYSSIADAIVAVIGAIAGFIIFLFPRLKILLNTKWFRSYWVSIFIIILIFLLVIGVYNLGFVAKN